MSGAIRWESRRVRALRRGISPSRCHRRCTGVRRKARDSLRHLREQICLNRFVISLVLNGLSVASVSNPTLYVRITRR